MHSDLPAIQPVTPRAGISADGRQWRRSMFASGLVHGVALTALIAQAAWVLARPAVLVARGFPGATLQASLVSVERPLDQASVAVLAKEAELSLKADATPAANDDNFAGEFEAGLAARLQMRLELQTSAATAISADENRQQLDRLGKQLGGLSSEQNVDDMAKKFQQWLGTDRRAVKPSEQPVDGEFDFETAQLHEIRRSRGADGEWQYASILVDAAGRTLQSPLDDVQGKSAFETMEIVKQNPLMEMVYRKIAMSLLDDLIKSSQQLEKARQEAAAAQPSK